jgi:cellulose synthase (UDP-forming)
MAEFANLIDLDVGFALLLTGAFLVSFPWLDRGSVFARQAFYWTSAYLLVRYTLWRALVTLPTFALKGPVIFAYVFFAFELWLNRKVLAFNKMLIRSQHRSVEVDAHMTWYSARQKPPLVDYLIPTYNEDYATLERAIVGALSQDYERVRVWILDDGRRAWLRELAEQKGVNYLTRPDNAGFKAGNLNHALDHIATLSEASDFFAVMDCDFLGMPGFVRRTLALMWDPKVAIVQSKQIYYNLDPFQYALPGGQFLPDWQRYGFDMVAPAVDVFGGQTCCGTCFLARTSAFQMIGGMPTESVAEDALATFALAEFGLKTIYLDEGLSYGIVAEGLTEFLTQCGRWCFGRVQNIYSRWGGMSPKKSWLERWGFFHGNLDWSVFTINRLMQMWLPIAYWFFGFQLYPVQGTNEGFIQYFFVMWLFNTVIETWLTRATSPPIISDARQLLWAEVIVRATLRALRKSKNFRFDVTDKGVLRSQTFVHWKPLKWLILIGGLTVAGLFYRALAKYPPPASEYDIFAYFWTFYNLLCIATAIRICIEPAQRRQQQRFPTKESGTLIIGGRNLRAAFVNLSVSGALLTTDAPLSVGQEVLLELEEVGAIPSVVVRATAAGVTALGFHANEKQREQLIRKVYSAKYVRPIIVGNVRQIYRGLLANTFT